MSHPAHSSEKNNQGEQNNLRQDTNEKLYKLLVDSVQDYAIFMLDPAGRVISWNLGAERIKGYTAEEIIDKHFSIFYPSDVAKAGFPQYGLDKALEEGRFEDEGWRVRKDGSLFWAHVVITPLYDQPRVPLGYAKITRDLTERRRNEELTRKNQELLRINQELDSFVYTASHDLKAPVLNIEGLLKAMEKQLSSQIQQNQTIRQIYQLLYSSIARFKATIADLTEVARIGKETREDLAHIGLEEVLQQVLADLEPQFQEADAQVAVRLDCLEIHFSRKHFKSILYNLLSNALKYRSPHRVLHLRVTCQTQEDYHVLSVEDNGLGIDMRQEEKVFALFKRLHTHVEGTGIGLYIVKKLVENAGGKIQVESQVGVGSTFRLYFKR